jgi:ribosomal protein L1
LAHSKSESKIKPLEKMLGQKGSYPNRKNGNLTDDLDKELDKCGKGEINLKFDKAGNLQLLIGQTDFNLEQLLENQKNAYNRIISLKPNN